MARTSAYPDQKIAFDNKMTELRPAYLEIDLEAFANNFRKVKSLIEPKTSVMAVVKANAYGHGLVPIALAAEKCGADFLGVAFIEEGKKLLEAGIKTPIVVLYPDLPERALALAKTGLIATAGSRDYLQALNEAGKTLGKKVKTFIKIETGMGRYGLLPEEINPIAALMRSMPAIQALGVSTNLADSSNSKSQFTNRQFAEFDSYLGEIETSEMIQFKGIENSGGVLYHHNSKFNLVRVGIMLYGVSPNGKLPEGFSPVMSFKSRIVQVKHWPQGKPIGYGGHFIPLRDSLIATIPVGYADGYPWALSNKGFALVGEKRVPLIGKICMDAMMLDVTDIPGVKTGDEAVLMGKQGRENIPVEELATPAGSFAYELLSCFSDRLPRIYIGE